MSITARDMTGGDTGALGRLPMLAPPLAALLYPFALEGFHTSVARIAEGASILSWLSAAASLALAFAMPLIAMLAAMSFSEIGRPTVAQLRAKRTALLALAAPTLFVFVGVVLTMLHDPVPDTWLWVTCWAIALALLLRSDNSVPAVLAPRPIPAPLRVAHGVSALAIVMDIADLFQGAARYVDRIFRGEKPHDLPVQAPTKFRPVVNRKTAKALGLTVRTATLLRADEVID